MNDKYNYEYETFEDMILDNLISSTSNVTVRSILTIKDMISVEWSASGGVTVFTEAMGQWLSYLAAYTYMSDWSTTANASFSDLYYKIASSIYYWYSDLKPVWTFDEMSKRFKKYLSTANKKLPNVLSVTMIETLLNKYGLPNDLISFAAGKQDSKYPTYEQLDDFLVWRYLKDNTSTDYTGNEKSEGTGTSSSTSSDSGTGRQWNRSRPINYTTTDETTADSVQGQSSESSGSDNYESSDTLNRDTTNNTERERILTERRTTLLQFMKELTGVLDNWIADLVQSLNPCFVQEMGI